MMSGLGNRLCNKKIFWLFCCRDLIHIFIFFCITKGTWLVWNLWQFPKILWWSEHRIITFQLYIASCIWNSILNFKISRIISPQIYDAFTSLLSISYICITLANESPFQCAMNYTVTFYYMVCLFRFLSSLLNKFISCQRETKCLNS